MLFPLPLNYVPLQLTYLGAACGPHHRIQLHCAGIGFGPNFAKSLLVESGT